MYLWIYEAPNMVQINEIAYFRRDTVGDSVFRRQLLSRLGVNSGCNRYAANYNRHSSIPRDFNPIPAQLLDLLISKHGPDQWNLSLFREAASETAFSPVNCSLVWGLIRDVIITLQIMTSILAFHMPAARHTIHFWNYSALNMVQINEIC